MAMSNAEKQAAHRQRQKTFDGYLQECVTSCEAVAASWLAANHVLGDPWSVVEGYLWEHYADDMDEVPEHEHSECVVDQIVSIARSQAEGIRFWTWVRSSHFWATLTLEAKQHCSKQKELSIDPAGYHAGMALNAARELNRRFGWAVPSALELRQKRRIGRKPRVNDAN